MNKNSIEIVLETNLLAKGVLYYDVVLSLIQFDDKRGIYDETREKQHIRVIYKLEFEDCSDYHLPGSAFLIDVMANARRGPLDGFLLYLPNL